MPIKVVLFDFMGTCLNWHSTIVAALPDKIDDEVKSDFALEWRQAYFDASQERARCASQTGQEYEDIDITHRRTLSAMLQNPRFESVRAALKEDSTETLINAWHRQMAWPDMADALRALREDLGLEVVVHANGTTRLQMDNVKASGLSFDMLFSSEMLGVYKPAPESFHKALRMLKCEPRECVMVAAHAYDVRGAKAVGIPTIYVYRWTDDILEDQSQVRAENDVYLEDGMQGVVQAVKSLM